MQFKNVRSAFSLSELIGVLAIVAILAALFFPVFAKARSARAGSCLSNLQQNRLAVGMYAQDYDEFRAPAPWLAFYKPYFKPAGTSICPTFGPIGLPMHLEARDAHRNAGGGGSGGNLIWHNGGIMPSSNTYMLFWGPSWKNYTGDKITGMETWYQGYGATSYANTNTEYTGTNGQVTWSSLYLGKAIDSATTPPSAPSVSQVLSEVCSQFGNTIDTSGYGYYAVYSSGTRGSAGYCAWHSYGTCNGSPVQIAFFFNLDGDAGCDPQSTVAGQSQGLQAIANVSGHELSEAVTDPRNGGWYDRRGQENADKCAWTFGAPYVTFNNGSQWKIQRNWSNAAGGCIQTK